MRLYDLLRVGTGVGLGRGVGEVVSESSHHLSLPQSDICLSQSSVIGDESRRFFDFVTSWGRRGGQGGQVEYLKVSKLHGKLHKKRF